jgi:hypothetical protein
MSQSFGIESPSESAHTPHRKPARYLIIIEAAGAMVARLFTDAREPVAEFDASTEEVAQMTQGLTPTAGAPGPEWDRALEGHNASERGAAEVYTLDV